MSLPLPEKVSPVTQLCIDRFGGKTYSVENVLLMAGAVNKLLVNNPNRLFWIAINEGAVDVRLSTETSVGTGSGWVLVAAGGVISMFWEEDGEAVTYDIYAKAVSSTCYVRVKEVIRI
jgi:hypothetical protein